MPITEILLTGYDGNEAVLAVTLAPDEANVVLMRSDDNVVDSTWCQPTDAFAEFQKLLELTCMSR